MPKIADAKIAILATNGFEQSELEVPLQKLKAHGAEVHVITPDGDDIKGWDTDNWGQTVKSDRPLDQALVADYDALVLPGGQINPDILRAHDGAMAFIRDFVETGKPIAAICHAPWLLIEAEAVKGRKMTSYHSIKTDLINAGADWQDTEVVADSGIVTSRSPEDLEAFVKKIVEEVEEGRHIRDAA
ncbi:MAG: type 1 glutamine amidotransferase [Silicimonas sp.]|nr:type 1 glutamine amidotransferase [Silicimonas sp.]NND40614.1 type 1 glutamine amidotransferase [Silicimonas sp.]